MLNGTLGPSVEGHELVIFSLESLCSVSGPDECILCLCSVREQRLIASMKKASVTFGEGSAETAHRRPEEHGGGGGKPRKPTLVSKPKQTLSQLSAQEWHKT